MQTQPRFFFTSDTHFGHAGVIQFAKRPFDSPSRMDEALIANWNSVVQPNDHIYHLGDFAWGDEKRIARILSRLNGIKFLILGNHDKVLRQCKSLHGGFRTVCDYLELAIDGRRIVLCHYPMISWHGMRRGAWM